MLIGRCSGAGLARAEYTAKDLVETTTELLERVRERSCAEGADAVLGVKNGSGACVQATAVRWTEAPATEGDKHE